MRDAGSMERRRPRCPVVPRIVATLGVCLELIAPGWGQQVGEPMPPLVVAEWVQGDPGDGFAWGDGKVYLLDLWGTWYAPCIALMPELSELHETYRERGFAVIGYSWEEPETVRRFLARRHPSARYLFATDPQERTMQRLAEAEAIEGFPYSFLIDERGIVRWKGPGKDARAAVESYFEERR
jgi:thiol-disulfide isomerase/thioredoxin